MRRRRRIAVENECPAQVWKHYSSRTTNEEDDDGCVLPCSVWFVAALCCLCVCVVRFVSFKHDESCAMSVRRSVPGRAGSLEASIRDPPLRPIDRCDLFLRDRSAVDSKDILLHKDLNRRRRRRPNEHNQTTKQPHHHPLLDTGYRSTTPRGRAEYTLPRETGRRPKPFTLLSLSTTQHNTTHHTPPSCRPPPQRDPALIQTTPTTPFATAGTPFWRAVSSFRVIKDLSRVWSRIRIIMRMRMTIRPTTTTTTTTIRF